MIRHFLSFGDLSLKEYEYVFQRTRWIRDTFKRYERYWPLEDRSLAMIFEKQSTRTRLSFEAGIQQLGGMAIYLNTQDTQLGRGEPVEDTAQVISRMVDMVMIRTFEQEIVERFAKHSRVPVINGLTNQHHPCQILSDVFTYIEHRGTLAGRIVAWIGDANNVCRSWLDAAQTFDFQLRVSSPPGYDALLRSVPASNAINLSFVPDPMEAARGVDLITTDVWVSMGQEAQGDVRRKAFKPWQVNAKLMKQARPDALFMHCLPAHQGEEVSADIFYGPQSVVWEEAENRLHTQKALMEFLLLGMISPS